MKVHDGQLPAQQARLEMLERTVMELGAEIFAMKAQVARSKESSEQILGVVKGLKQLLDEKGLITLDDFDAAVELGAALETFSASAAAAETGEIERSKKSSH